MQTLVFLTLALLPPIISGPLPAVLVFKTAPLPQWRQQLPFTIMWTIILDLIAFALIITNLDGFLPAGFMAGMLVPVAAAATLIVSTLWLRRRVPDPNADPDQRRWLRWCLVAIPLLQLFMLIVLLLIWPALCNSGIRSCPDL